VRLYVLVSQGPSTNRSYQQQVEGVWVGNGSLRISPAHYNRGCRFMHRSDRDHQHTQIVELPSEWLEHPLFRDLGTCRRCWPKDTRRIV
jgi:hypothetical protein